MDKLLLIADSCGGLLPIGVIVYRVIRVFWILIPIALILYGTIDLGKAVIASDEKEVKAAQSRLIKRFIYAVVVFFVPLLVNVVMGLVAGSGDTNMNQKDVTSFSGCWNEIRNNA